MVHQSANQTTITWIILLFVAITLLVIGANYFINSKRLQSDLSQRPLIASYISPNPTTTPAATDSALVSAHFLNNLRNEIVMVQKSLDSNIDQESLIMEVSQIRRRITNAYLTVDTTTQQELKALDSKLEVVEDQTRQSTAQGLARFDELAKQLEQDIRSNRTAQSQP